VTKPILRERGKKLSISRLGGAVILVGISLLVALVVIISAPDDDSVESVQQQPVVMTTDPQIILNLTALPQATALSGAAAKMWDDFRVMVDDCDAYSPERRLQMEQHIEWLLDPSDMPPNVIFAMGGDPTERLVFGMATYTSIQWRLNDRLPDSCLVPIGLALDDILLSLGTESLDIYDDE
jgi:hypothetical protein